MRESEVKNTIANAFAKVEIHKTNLSLTQVALRGKKKKSSCRQIYSNYLPFQK